MTAPEQAETFFRHEYGQLVATLSRRVGVQHIEDIEDAVQSALVTALETWTKTRAPDNPAAWLFRVAYNNLLGEFRQRATRQRLLKKNASEVPTPQTTDPESFLPGELKDDLLHLLFICCDEAIPTESQLVLALKTLCGFDVREISHRLFTSEANIYKRLSRARSRLQQTDLPELNDTLLSSRLSSVHKILYLLFTEGYLSSHTELAIRRELCSEAIRLATLLAENPIGQTPETSALLALMHLHTARLAARQDADGTLLLLEEQDRTLWDTAHIQTGLSWLAQSAQGQNYSRYHAEAGIAAEHCLAPNFAATRWDQIASSYALLEQIAPSPLHTLNRAVAIAEWKSPAAALELLQSVTPPPWLTASYLWSAVHADLHRRAKQPEQAKRYRESALAQAPTPAIRALLERRLTMLATD